MSKKTVALLLSLAVTLAGCGSSESSHGPQVKNRQAAFDKILHTKDDIGLVVHKRKPYEAREFLEQTRELQRLSREPWGYFTADSHYPPTRAKPQVWESPEEFAAGKRDFENDVTKLTKAAEGGELKAISDAFAEVEKDCMSCHKKFRNPIPLR